MIGLIGKIETECVMMNRKSIPNEIGGFDNVWVESEAVFKAAITKDTTLAARVAEKEGVTEVYTITVPKGLPLEFHDVVKRLEDGATFRVMSNIKDSETPPSASFQIGVVSAERYELV